MAENDEHLQAMRHSLAHILAYAVQDLYKNVKFGVGPVIEDGFYYDFDLGQTISEEDLNKIEDKMKEIISSDLPFNREDVDTEEALRRVEEEGQFYKAELVRDLKNKGTTELSEVANEGVKTVSFYTIGSFTDLCRGGHVDSTGKVGVFKLMRVSGAYWRGSEKNPQMQRVYGVTFATEKELRQHLNMLEEAKKRDHRKIGQELDLFIFSDLVGSGLPLYTPRGTIVRNSLIGFSEEVRESLEFERVWSPHITKKELYQTSGHWEKFGDELFLVKSQETSDELVMKPMNCPHHAQIYASRPRSYRDLPLKLMETTTNYRDEKTGELHGLSRVRSLTQDDSHTYCRPDQVGEIFDRLIEKIHEFYTVLGMELRLRLSLRDESDAYLGPQELWDYGQAKLGEIVKRNKLDYYSEEGEAAFYGPKLDFMAKDAIGRVWQVATIQFDFVQPERFKLEYTDETGEQQRPIMIHCAIMGSFDRFFSVYIEHTAGKFPIWLAPEQVRVITVNQEFETTSFAEEVAVKAKELGVRLTVDNSNESVGKKIRNAELMKVPYTLVIGEKEISSGRVTPRVRNDLVVVAAHPELPIDNFLKSVLNETKSRVSKTSM